MANPNRYDDLQTEGGEGYRHDDEITRQQIENHVKALAAAQIEEWTLEVTAERRAVWNGLIRSHVGKLTMADVAGFEKRLGFKFADMKSAIARHGL